MRQSPINGTNALVVSATATQIVVTIPNGSGSGAVVVICGGNQVNAGTLTMTSGNLPSITSFTPTLGTTGTAVTVSGSNFQSNADRNNIWFNISRGTVTTSSSSTTRYHSADECDHRPLEGRYASRDRAQQRLFLCTTRHTYGRTNWFQLDHDWVAGYG